MHGKRLRFENGELPESLLRARTPLFLARASRARSRRWASRRVSASRARESVGGSLARKGEGGAITWRSSSCARCRCARSSALANARLDALEKSVA